MIGLGVQGRVNLIAMHEVFPGLKRVQVYDTVESQAGKFLSDMKTELPNAEFVSCPDIKKAVADADVVVTCTPIVEKPERFVKRERLKDDILAVSVDYDSAMDAKIMAGNFVCDNKNQYLWTQEQGGYFQNGYLQKGGIYADMGEVCAGKKEGV